MKAFLIIMLALFASESKADVSLEVGATFLSSDFADGGALLLLERFGKYDFGLGYVSTQFVNTCGRPDCDNDIRANIFVHAQRIVTYKRCELGIGAAYFGGTNRALSKHLNFSLMAGCNITKRIFIRGRHISNAGSGDRNLGQDMLTIGWRF